MGGDEGCDNCPSPAKPLRPPATRPLPPPPPRQWSRVATLPSPDTKISRKSKGSRCGAHMVGTEVGGGRGFPKFVPWDPGPARCPVN